MLSVPGPRRPPSRPLAGVEMPDGSLKLPDPKLEGTCSRLLPQDSLRKRKLEPEQMKNKVMHPRP